MIKRHISKIKSGLKNLSKALIVAGGLMIPLLTKTAQTQEPVRQNIESGENSVERNRNLLRENEYIVSRDVMRLYAQTVDPRTFGMVSGGFFEHDYLDTRSERRTFSDSLRARGYSNEEIRNFREMFKNKNIVFSESILDSPEFVPVLRHERMHKYISELPAEEQNTLNEAVDFIISDYNQKQPLWIDEEMRLEREYHERFRDRFNYEAYSQVQDKVDSLIRIYSPILHYDSRDQSFRVQTIRDNPKELLPYLMIGGIGSGIESVIENRFPQSARIYNRLKERIENETRDQQ